MGNEFLLVSDAVPEIPTASAGDLRIAVVFTNFEETELALRRAGKLSAGLHAEIDLIAAQVVPFVLPLAEPAVPVQFTMTRLDELAIAAGVQINIHLFLCRNNFETLASVLRQHSPILVGFKKRWFRRQPGPLVKALRKLGHDIIVAGAD